ncbi:hypothetical protein [Oerskovia flava]|uniref:hypothetical protein n=1 Tax=Oerskovia flava TaxID=2986422 RepID=UPI00223F1AD8|nr:hypothetical protein [Oerskovia sp. JB1-3-2]
MFPDPGVVPGVDAGMDSGFGGVFALGIVAVLAVAVVGFFRAQQRNEATHRLHGWATSHGWRVVGEDESLVRRWPGRPFGKGDRRRATDVLRGQVEGYPATSFTYTWVTRGSGHSVGTVGDHHMSSSDTTEEAHVVAIELPAALPHVELTPEGMWTAVAKAFGGEDLEVGSPAFDAAWRVRTSDVTAARALLVPPLVDRLSEPEFARRSYVLDGRTAYTWTKGRTDPGDILPAARRLATIADLTLGPSGPVDDERPDWGTPDH